MIIRRGVVEPHSDSDEDCVIVFDSNRMIEAGVPLPPEVRNVSRDLSHCQIYVLQQ